MFHIFRIGWTCIRTEKRTESGDQSHRTVSNLPDAVRCLDLTIHLDYLRLELNGKKRNLTSGNMNNTK